MIIQLDNILMRKTQLITFSNNVMKMIIKCTNGLDENLTLTVLDVCILLMEVKLNYFV